MLKLFLPNNLALWAKLSAWNFSWAFGSVVQWQNNGAALFYRLSQSWGPSGPHTQHSGEASGRGTSAALAPLAVKWMFLDESKHTLSCVCGSQVAEELPLAGGPRGTRTEAPVKSHTYKRSRHTAREQLTHFLLTGLTVQLLSILLNPQITNIYKVFPSETLTVTVVLWQKCRKFVSKCIILLM